jgi:hypothetical protein
MARCARSACARWRPNALARLAHLGVTLNDAWFCSTRCLEIEAEYAISEARHHDGWTPHPGPRIGRLLLQRRAVSPQALDAALRAQRVTGRRLGAELVATQATTEEQVLRALAAQAGIGCLLTLDVARVVPGPGGLSRQAVQSLQVVPFDANDGQQKLSVACRSPLPAAALGAVRQITGWHVQPFLVPDALLDRLIEAYASSRAGPGADGEPVDSVPDAAVAIARTVQQGVARRMHHVRCDSIVWVRLEGDALAHDLLVTLGDGREETGWQAAPTRH